MDYISTRGSAPAVQFETALLSGLAPDGGLYLPARWPHIDGDFSKASFSAAAAQVLAPFVSPWIDRDALEAMTASAFASFARAEVAPLVRLGEHEFLLELFHGPTLAFKDIAMQMLARFFEHALGRSGRRVTVIGATSGDTGAAAIEAFRGSSHAQVFILHPRGRVSDVQRLMMTTVADKNVHNIAVNGTFDDCQRIVKILFADREFSERVSLTGVNSINWARLAVQTVYYFTALAELKKQTGEGRAAFCVPTGNFGDAFAGYAARRMGAPISRLCLAVNHNDILHRAMATRRYRPTEVTPTMSPSMDIQVASNFERLLFEASQRDGAAVRTLTKRFDETGEYEIPAEWHARMREDFVSERVSEAEVAQTIANLENERGLLIDPHTAVGLAAARKARASGRLSRSVITLATAHPAKFPDAVEKAAGRRPEPPEGLKQMTGLAERFTIAEPDSKTVRDIVLACASGKA